MTTPIAVGVIGANRYAAALHESAAPLSRGRVTTVAPSPNAHDRTAAAALARALGAAFVPDPDAVARDPSLAVVLVASDDPGRASPAEAALASGKIVVCPAPAARTVEALDRLSAARVRGGGLLLTPGELRYTPAGAQAVRLAASGEMGTLHSAFAAVRLPTPARVRDDLSVLDRSGWDVLDVLCAALPYPVRRVHATVSSLFGASEDTAVVVARLEQDVIVTIELSRCLPASIPAVPQGEAEIEIIGSRQSVRIEPYRTAVRFYGEREVAGLPWIDEPVLSMVGEAICIATGDAERTDQSEHARRVLGFMDAVRASAARGDAVEISAR